MKKRTVWIALGMAVVLSAASVTGALVFANENTVTSESKAAEEQTEALESGTIAAEADEPEETDAETVEETASETETDTGAEAETEVETETEMETEKEESPFIAVSYQEEDAWAQVAITNSEYVETGVVIRSEASSDSEALGYLYKGTAMWVIEKGDTWTQFYSNGITGYVMTAYLLFDADVAEIAEVYGAEGVHAEWDDVNIYTSDDAATVIDTMDAGDVFQVVNDYGHWIEIQYDEDTTAYVSGDDVTSVMLFEGATPKDGERVQLVKLYGETYVEETTEEAVEVTDTEQTEASSTEASSSGSSSDSSSTGSSSTGSSSTGSSSSSGSSSGSSSSSSSSSQTEAAQTETTASTEAVQTETTASTEAAQTETTASTEATQTETSSSGSSSSSSDGYYDADTDTYYDADGNVISTGTASDEPDTASYTEAETAASTEAAQTEAASSTEAETADSTAAASSSTVSTDDTTLLAALIYCEAGNQSYEGMVAVGAVVMNRVNSSSFPNTISEVIYQSGQFTPASSGSLASAIANGVPSTCYEAAAAAIAGEDPTGGALYFNTTANKGIQIGDHWFY